MFYKLNNFIDIVFVMYREKKLYIYTHIYSLCVCIYTHTYIYV